MNAAHMNARTIRPDQYTKNNNTTVGLKTTFTSKYNVSLGVLDFASKGVEDFVNKTIDLH